jgi:hypothetical protein
VPCAGCIEHACTMSAASRRHLHQQAGPCARVTSPPGRALRRAALWHARRGRCGHAHGGVGQPGAQLRLRRRREVQAVGLPRRANARSRAHGHTPGHSGQQQREHRGGLLRRAPQPCGKPCSLGRRARLLLGQGAGAPAAAGPPRRRSAAAAAATRAAPGARPRPAAPRPRCGR